MPIIKPSGLKKGDTVGIVAPSASPFDNLETAKQFDDGIKSLEQEWGLKIKIGKNIRKQRNYSAGTWQERLEDFHAMWKDSDVKAVIMAIGGHTAIQLLDHIDYNLIQKNPKIFCGISDATTLLNPIYVKTGLVTYHGPDVCFTFGLPIPNEVKDNIVQTWFNGGSIELKPLKNFVYSEHPDKKYDGWKSLKNGKASGRLIGGNIGILTRLLAAKSLTSEDFKNHVLFLEGTDPVHSLGNDLYVLKLAGVFKEIKGIILGYCEWAEEEKYHQTVSELILEVTKDYSFPILQIGELGHCVDNYIFPIGCQATIDADYLKTTIDENTVS